MIPVTQTQLHDPANGKHGNCLSAVLASLLHVSIETIPVFSSKDTWLQDLNAWLRPRGLAYLSLPDAGFTDMLKTFGIEGLHHETFGESKRFTDVNHACVGEDGRLVFDPHPTREAEGGGMAVEGHGLFIALEPWRMQS